MLDKKSPLPLYYQLKEELKKQIVSGLIMPGDKLLSEAEMIEKYGVGRLTIREALSQLVNEGFLEKQHGKGTFCKSILLQNNNLNIDVLLNTSDNYFIPYYIRGINEVLTNSNSNFRIHDTKNDMQEVEILLEKILQKGTSGVILQPSSKEERLPSGMSAVFKEYEAHAIPLIMIDSCYEGIESSYVIMDEFKGGYISAEHLLGKGHKNIAGIFPKEIRDSQQRQKGVEEAVRKAGKHVKVDWVLWEEGFNYEKVDTLLTALDRATAIVCYNDEIALDCLKYFRSKGVMIPQELAIIGYDDTFLAQSSEIALTSVAHPKEDMGRLAAEKLIGMIEKTVSWPFTYTFQPMLVVRETT